MPQNRSTDARCCGDCPASLPILYPSQPLRVIKVPTGRTTLSRAWKNPAKPVALATALPWAAVAPTVAALAVIASSGKAATTPRVKALFGAVFSKAPSTNARTCSCNNFRPRERRCFTASSLNSKLAATASMD